MTPESFDQVMQRLAMERPFWPFVAELVSGEKFEVDFPTAIVIRGGLAVFVAPGGVPIIFDHQGVVAIDGGTASASA